MGKAKARSTRASKRAAENEAPATTPTALPVRPAAKRHADAPASPASTPPGSISPVARRRATLNPLQLATRNPLPGLPARSLTLAFTPAAKAKSAGHEVNAQVSFAGTAGRRSQSRGPQARAQHRSPGGLRPAHSHTRTRIHASLCTSAISVLSAGVREPGLARSIRSNPLAGTRPLAQRASTPGSTHPAHDPASPAHAARISLGP